MIIKYLNYLSLSLVLSLIYSSIHAQNITKSDFIGHWFVEELDNSTIEIVETKAGGYEGFIRKSDKSEYVGKKMLYDCTYNSDENQLEGTIYSVARNMELGGTFTILSKDELKVVAQKFIISKTIFWKRRDSY